MKKCFFLTVLLFALNPLFAADDGIDIEPFWQLGTIYLGGDLSSQGVAISGSGDVLNLGLSFYPGVTERSFKFQISPFSVSPANIENSDSDSQFGIGVNEEGSVFREFLPSFLNVNLSYNFLDSQVLELSPFIGGKYFFLSGFDNYLFETGIEFSFFTSDLITLPTNKFPLKTKIISARLGGRCLNGEFSAFAEVGVDLGILVYAILSDEYKEAVEIHEGRSKPKTQ